jgi:hypothetical protein
MFRKRTIQGNRIFFLRANSTNIDVFLFLHFGMHKLRIVYLADI